MKARSHENAIAIPEDSVAEGVLVGEDAAAMAVECTAGE